MTDVLRSSIVACIPTARYKACEKRNGTWKKKNNSMKRGMGLQEEETDKRECDLGRHI